MDWYNNKHWHSAMKFVAPAQRHKGEDKAILRTRHEFYQQQRDNNPQRCSKNTRNWSYTDSVTLNPDQEKTAIS